jgi:hypothetical protein
MVNVGKGCQLAEGCHDEASKANGTRPSATELHRHRRRTGHDQEMLHPEIIAARGAQHHAFGGTSSFHRWTCMDPAVARNLLQKDDPFLSESGRIASSSVTSALPM